MKNWVYGIVGLIFMTMICFQKEVGMAVLMGTAATLVFIILAMEKIIDEIKKHRIVRI